MHFDDLASFWQMGGYALYVWLSFGVALFSVAVMWIQAWLTKQSLLKRVLQEQARQARIQAAKQSDQRSSGEQG
ncbi:heme exporter protein CcmD [Paraglaciecola aestuariivivens]